MSKCLCFPELILINLTMFFTYFFLERSLSGYIEFWQGSLDHYINFDNYWTTHGSPSIMTVVPLQSAKPLPRYHQLYTGLLYLKVGQILFYFFRFYYWLWKYIGFKRFFKHQNKGFYRFFWVRFFNSKLNSSSFRF